MTTKPLTNDERKAAEAAFRGLPFNSSWSAAARVVYDGIIHSTQGRTIVSDPELAELLEKVAAMPLPDMPIAKGAAEAISDSIVPPSTSVPPSDSVVSESEEETVLELNEGEVPTFGTMTREEAVQAGLLVDVTPTARQVGLSLPVSFTKPVWDVGITAGNQIPEDQHPARVRDLLIALRLFLEQARVTSPLMEFSALLSVPPDTVPELCPLYVLAHREAAALPYSLTVLLPREVSVMKILPES